MAEEKIVETYIAEETVMYNVPAEAIRHKYGNLDCKKEKFSIKDFFSKCEQICWKLRIWSHLPKKS